MSEKINELKNKIENELNKINILYEKTLNEVEKSYKEKHEKLLKEEKALKQNLQNKVSKTKEQLENISIDIKKEIEIIEKIDKNVQKIKSNDKNMIKILSYISYINKTKKNMKKFFKILMKSMEFSYEEKENNIIYDEYYFNGFIMPTDIEISDITCSNFKISWKINNINIDNSENIENDKIKFKLELKKENENFKQMYEENNNYFLYDNLFPDTKYELRICSIYNNMRGEWSQIQKVKTRYFDSMILNESKKGIQLLKKLYEWIGNKKLELIFRGTRDGMNSKNFHDKCDNQGKTICLFKNEKDNIFGGYSSKPIGGEINTFTSAPDSFLFTLTNIHNSEPTKFPSKNDGKEIWNTPNYGPVFGGGPYDLGINGDFINEGGWSNFPYSYQDILGKGKSVFTGDLNNKNSFFKIKEIETFKLIE